MTIVAAAALAAAATPVSALNLLSSSLFSGLFWVSLFNAIYAALDAINNHLFQPPDLSDP